MYTCLSLSPKRCARFKCMIGLGIIWYDVGASLIETFFPPSPEVGSIHVDFYFEFTCVGFSCFFFFKIFHFLFRYVVQQTEEKIQFRLSLQWISLNFLFVGTFSLHFFLQGWLFFFAPSFPVVPFILRHSPSLNNMGVLVLLRSLVPLVALPHSFLFACNGFNIMAFWNGLSVQFSLCALASLSGLNMSLNSAPSCASRRPPTMRGLHSVVSPNANTWPKHHHGDISAAQGLASPHLARPCFAPAIGQPFDDVPAPAFGFGSCVAHLLPAGCYYFCSGCCYIRTRDVDQYEGLTPLPGLSSTEVLQLDVSQISLMSALAHMQREVAMLSRTSNMLLEMEREHVASVRSLRRNAAALEWRISASHRMCIQMNMRIKRTQQLLDYAEATSRTVTQL